MTIDELEEILADHFPPGYDATKDPLADRGDHERAVNLMGTALREAVAMLKKNSLPGSEKHE